MFIGREKELSILEDLNDSKKFEMLVLFGRRRVGKTEILKQFVAKHKAFMFSAIEQNTALNLESFSRTAGEYFSEPHLPPFTNWQNALDYIDGKIDKEILSKGKKAVVVIDEFPYIAKAFPAIKSIFQHLIDHKWKDKNILLILCGSSVSFMLNEVMGQKSPLYGRKTSQLEILPFDYLTSAKFVPGYSNLDKIITYGILGGIPKYLEVFDDKLTLAKNIEKNVVAATGSLHEEPSYLLRIEFREPALYNSILDAIATGSSKMNEITTKIKEDTSKSNKYLTELQIIKLVEKIVPCGDKENSKKTIYLLKDNFFKFWYSFMFRNKNKYALMDEDEIAQSIMENVSNYMGLPYERICMEFMIKLAKAKKLPFIPAQISKWWGSNPVKKKKVDVDILALSADSKQAIFCECKFTNEKFDSGDLTEMIENANLFSQVEKRVFYIFSKNGITKGVEERIASEKLEARIFSIDDLFN